MKFTIVHNLHRMLNSGLAFGGAELHFNFPRHTIRFNTVHSTDIYRLWQVASMDDQGYLRNYETLGFNPGGYPSPGLPVPREAVASMASEYENPLHAELWSHEFAETIESVVSELETWRARWPLARAYELNPSMKTSCEDFARYFTAVCELAAEELSEWNLLPRPNPAEGVFGG